MSDAGQHVNFALAEKDVLAPDAVAHRRAARAVLEAARPFRLLAFRVADTHVHLLLAVGREGAGEAVRRVKIALAATLRPSSAFALAHDEPVRGHARGWRAFRYVLGQDRHHGCGHDPYAEASNLPDLLGLREPGAWTRVEVRRRLPRVGRAELLGALGVTDLQPGPVALDELAEATLSATALESLAGNRTEAVAARLAAVHATPEPPAAVARVLGVSARAVQKLRHCPPDANLVRAVQLQADPRRRRSFTADLVGEPSLAYGLSAG